MAAIPLTAIELKIADEQALRDAAFHGDLRGVNRYLKKGVSVNAIAADEPGKPSHRTTALHQAAAGGHAEIFQALCDAGGDPSFLDGNKAIPLQIAMTQEEAARRNGDTAKVEKFAKTVAIIQKWTVLTPAEQKKIHDNAVASVIEATEYPKETTVIRKFKEVQHPYTRAFASITTSNHKYWKSLESYTGPEKQSMNVWSFIEKHDRMWNQALREVQKKEASPAEFNQSLLYMLTLVFAESVRFDRVFKSEATKILTCISQLPDRKIRKRVSPLFQTLSSSVTDCFAKLPQAIIRKLSEDVRYIEDYYKFINNYFPEEQINFLAAYSLQDPHKKLVEEGNPVGKNIIIQQARRYFSKQLADLGNFIEDKKDTITVATLTLGGEINFEEIRDFVMSSAFIFIQSRLKKIETGFNGDISNVGFFLPQMFFKSQAFLFAMRTFLSSKMDSLQLIRERMDAIRREFIADLVTSEDSAAAGVSHDTVLAGDRKVKKEFAKEGKAERKAADEELLFMRRMAEEKAKKDIEEQRAKEEWTKRILGKLVLGRDKKEIDLILQILTSPSVPVSFPNFLALITKLEIPGYENITAAGSLPDNKLTINFGKFATMTFERRHGTDRADNVHPAAVNEFKRMLEAIDLNITNFRTLVGDAPSRGPAAATSL